MAGSRNFNPMSGAGADDGNGSSVTSGSPAELKAKLAAIKETTSAVKEYDAELANMVEADEKAKKASQEYADQLNEQSKAHSESLSKAADAFGKGGEMLSRFGDELRKSAEGLRLTNPELANVAESFGTVAQETGNAVSAGMTGFAAGGPWGAAIAAAVEIVGSLAKAWVDSKAAEARVMEENEKTLSDLTEGYRQYHFAKGEKEGREFVERLEAEAEAMSHVNDGLELQTKLLHERKVAQAEIDSSEVALKLAQIDADKTMSEPEKIKARAEQQRKLTRIRAQGQLEALENSVKEAQDVYDSKNSNLSARQNSLDEASSQLEALKKQRAQGLPENPTRLQQNAYNRLDGDIKGITDKIERLTEQVDAAASEYGTAKGSLDLRSGTAKIKAEAIKRVFANQDAAANLATQSQLDQSTAKISPAKQGETGSLDSLREVGNRAHELSSEKRLSAQQRSDAEKVAKHFQTGKVGADDFDILERVLSLVIEQNRNDAGRSSQLKSLRSQIEDLERKFKADRGRGGR